MAKSTATPAVAARPATVSGASHASFDFDAYGTAHVPEDRDQDVVSTPYGRATVVRTRRDATSGRVMMRELELTDWTDAVERDQESARGRASGGPRRPALLFSPSDYPSVAPQVHDEVTCPFGRGTVIDIRKLPSQTEIVVVLISSWRLAGRSRVRCYLSPSSVQVVRPKRLYEKTVCERVEHGQALKQRANETFASKRYREALSLYTQAIDSVRYVQHKTDSSNEVRADLVVLLVTCYNNAGMCCSQLKDVDLWDDAARYASSAIILIEALEEKKGLKIHSVLLRDGFSDLKLFGEWKVKALLLKARALLERRNTDTDEALELIKQAQSVIKAFVDNSTGTASSLVSMEKEARKLHVHCKEQRKKEREREKKRALKMFAASEYYEEEKKEKSSPESSPPMSPTPGVEVGESGSDENDGVTTEGRAKRVSFSEHVSERLYQPDNERRSEASTKRNRGRPFFWPWNYHHNKFYTGLGLATGTLLVLVSVHRVLRLKQ